MNEQFVDLDSRGAPTVWWAICDARAREGGIMFLIVAASS